MRKTIVWVLGAALAMTACVSSAPVSGRVVIPFTRAFSASDLDVSKIEVEVGPAQLVFTLHYRTVKDRSLSFFDPPNGKVLMYSDVNGLKKDSDSVTFRIDRAKFSLMEQVTMRFSTNQNAEADRNFIFLTIDGGLRNGLDSTATAGRQDGREAAGTESVEDGRYQTNLTAKGALGIARRLPPADFSSGRGPLPALPAYNPDSGRMWQVDLRSRDVSSIDMKDRLVDLLHADFDSRTVWPKAMPAGFDPRLVMEQGRNPGLGIRRLHAAGITGKGVGIAIIDQGLLADHVEYRDRLRLYEEIHSGDASAAMHGPAVASIAVGKTVGVAPDADLYYIAETHGVYRGGSFDWDLTWLAKSIDRIVEVNAGLPKEGRIRVISISLGVSGRLRNGDKALEAIRRAGENGIYTVYVGSDPFFGLGRKPNADPDAFGSSLPGSFLAKSFYAGNALGGIGIPMDSRCTASPTGTDDYVFYSEGGMSWTVPYVAGLFALACQVKPDVTPELFWKAAKATGETTDIDNAGKPYRLGKIVSPARLIETLKGNP